MDFPKDKYVKVPACLNSRYRYNSERVTVCGHKLALAQQFYFYRILLVLSGLAGGWLGLDQVAPLTLNMKQQQQPAVPSLAVVSS